MSNWPDNITTVERLQAAPLRLAQTAMDFMLELTADDDELPQRLYSASELIAVTCDTCGSGNVLDGDKLGCPECIAMIENCLAVTGTDLRKESQ